jgi:hypothetical protein
MWTHVFFTVSHVKTCVHMWNTCEHMNSCFVRHMCHMCISCSHVKVRFEHMCSHVFTSNHTKKHMRVPNMLGFHMCSHGNTCGHVLCVTCVTCVSFAHMWKYALNTCVHMWVPEMLSFHMWTHVFTFCAAHVSHVYYLLTCESTLSAHVITLLCHVNTCEHMSQKHTIFHMCSHDFFMGFFRKGLRPLLTGPVM